jgi:hypothetical protein
LAISDTLTGTKPSVISTADAGTGAAKSMEGEGSARAQLEVNENKMWVILFCCVFGKFLGLSSNDLLGVSGPLTKESLVLEKFCQQGFSFFLSFFFAVLGLELRTCTLNHSTSPFFSSCEGFFRDRVSQTICPGWL